jgi:hypothetical protein
MDRCHLGPRYSPFPWLPVRSGTSGLVGSDSMPTKCLEDAGRAWYAGRTVLRRRRAWPLSAAAVRCRCRQRCRHCSRL